MIMAFLKADGSCVYWKMKTMDASASTLEAFWLEHRSLPNLSRSQWGWIIFFLVVLPSYLLFLRCWRFQRVNRMHQEFPFKTRQSLSNMTNDQAFIIQRCVAELEFPSFYEKGIQFPLFKTYGIPTMSRLLVKTGELSTPISASRRIADTVILITEFIGNPASSHRSREAIARMNYIHGLYQRSGQILQDDLLYTLILFASEPIKWIDRFEWRQLTDMEKCAFGTFWKSIGDSMRIEYKGKLSLADVDGKEGWTDGLHWLEDGLVWARQYENRVMVPNEASHEIADRSVDMILWGIPERFKSNGRKIITALMEEKLRIAIRFPPAPHHYVLLVHAFLWLRKKTLRYLIPPRPDFLRRRDLAAHPDKHTGRYFFRNFVDHPWYVRQDFLARWGPNSWITWLLGGTSPGDKGSERFKPDGYRISEVGPIRYEKKGRQEVKAEVERLKKQRTGGCPFAI